MSSKLFFFLINSALALYCCFQFLFLQASCATISSNMSSMNNSTSCSSSMECANLASNITYPFWGSASCAASASYVLSNCSSASTEAYWDSFSAAAHGVVGPPVVTSVSPTINSPYSQSSIELSWNESLNGMGICASFSSRNLSQYNIPSSINLAGFPDNSSALTFSSDNIFLLFNCTTSTDIPGMYQTRVGSACATFIGDCPASMENTSCNEWTVLEGTQNLMLQDILESSSCSHFTFGILRFLTDFVEEYGGVQQSWTTGSIEVIWTDTQCYKCVNAGGTCIPDPLLSAGSLAKFNQCQFHNIAFDFNTDTCGCRGGLLHCNKAAKIGILVALVIVLLVFGFALAAKYCGGMIRKGVRIGFFSFIRAIIPIAISVLKKTLKKLQTSTNYVPYNLKLGLDGLTERPMEYSYSSIASATKSFSSLLGEGGFGVVYKGTLPAQASSHGGSDVQIAVKVLEVRSKQSQQQFLNEVITIGRIHHVNVVRLLGFCMQEDHEMLVYEYIENGSLDRWLFDKQGEDQKQVLDWGQRYAIAMGIARGLSYLHEECRHRTVHCDIKPQNILLDGEMCPKIADFGLARLMSRDESKVVTIAKGTPGYMAPEFWMGGESQLNTKFDVYSYGMVLLELISGQRNFQRDATSIGSSFPAMAFKAATQGDLESILDARLGITKNTPDSEEAQKLQWHQIKTAVFVALWCIQDHPANRPCMSEVVKYLEGGASVSECLPQPTISIFSTSSTSPESHDSKHRQQDFTPISIGR